MQKHILLVDSDAESQSRLSQTLQQCDYRVSTASTCAESLAMIASDRPDIHMVRFEVRFITNAQKGMASNTPPATTL